MAWRSSLSNALSRSSWRPQHSFPFSTTPASGVSSLVESDGKRRLTRKAISFVFLSITGGLVLSAIDDFAVYHKCSSKALERASNDKSIQAALGEPIVRGPWYKASLAVVNKKRSASCTFPVIGPQGSGLLQVKAISHEENNWHDYLPGLREWEILVLEALVQTGVNEESNHTFRINLMENPNLSESKDCKKCKLVGS